MKRAIRNSLFAKALCLGLFILVVFSTTSVYSATVDQVLYGSWTPGSGGGGYQPFSLFDSSLGTLYRIDVITDIELSGIDPTGAGSYWRYSFSSVPSGYLFYYGETMFDGVYHREFSNTNDTVTGNVPPQAFFPLTNCIGSSGTNYQGISNVSSVTAQATTHLTYYYTPVPIPSAMLLLGSGLAGLVGLGRWRKKK